MGIDRFNNFILKSINNDNIDEVNIENNIKLVAANCIIFDINFLIYQEIIEIENDVNDIIKIILCLPFINNNFLLLEEYLKKILSQPHWKIYNFKNLFDGFNEDEIIHKFIVNITKKKSISENANELLSIIELIIFEKIVNKIIYLINKLHYTNFIQTIAIFFDGIPSFSKVIEQRRRRIKTFIESQERKKLYNKYFNELEINNKKLVDNLSKDYNFNKDDNLYFDYIKWIKNRFTTNKSISPSSIFLNNLEDYIKFKLSEYFTKCNIYIDSSKENGESDLKIFKYIALNNNNYDYSIHTIDSDLIHQILVQQTYYKIINRDINICLMKYTKKNNYIEYVQIIEASIIIKKLLESYNNINNTKINNYKIIWDICLIFYFFGNDHLPSSIEIGPELGLEYLFTNHFQALSNNNIINLKKSCITFNLNNLNLFLIKINENKEQNVTKIFLNRFFKIPYYLVNLLVDKFKFNFEDIKNFLKKFIIYKGLLLTSDELLSLDDDDMRKIFCENIENPESYINLSIFNFSEINNKLLIESIKLIEDNIDYYDQTYNGLIIYNKHIITTNDSYQDLYNIINEKTNLNLSNLYPLYYEYNDINQHINKKISYNINDYLKKMFHLAFTQFGNMENYHNDNITYYEYNDTPSIIDIINFINQKNINPTKIWLQEINNENLNKYLDTTSHYIIISPFLLNNNLSDKIYKEIKPIDNLWITDLNYFNYKKINIKEYLKNWYDLLNNKNIKEDFNDKINFLL